MTAGFVVPEYPYDRLDAARELAIRLPGGVVDLSIGTPTDPPPPAALGGTGGGGGRGSSWAGAAVRAWAPPSLRRRYCPSA